MQRHVVCQASCRQIYPCVAKNGWTQKAVVQVTLSSLFLAPEPAATDAPCLVAASYNLIL